MRSNATEDYSPNQLDEGISVFSQNIVHINIVDGPHHQFCISNVTESKDALLIFPQMNISAADIVDKRLLMIHDTFSKNSESSFRTETNTGNTGYLPLPPPILLPALTGVVRHFLQSACWTKEKERKNSKGWFSEKKGGKKSWVENIISYNPRWEGKVCTHSLTMFPLTHAPRPSSAFPSIYHFHCGHRRQDGPTAVIIPTDIEDI